jgi:acyl transferase domain-containing protein/NADPH:quinone reductase-like Zn-dependent oxidoreductase/SAM-dependent methyltransferase/acyl carrier protein
LTNNEYYQHLLHTLPPAELSPYLITGNVLNAAAGRIAFHLGTRGPSVAVDTACSSSLTAIHMACQGLKAGDCRMALAGGVNVIVIPETAVMFSKWGMMAADGRCKAFDAAADGFVRSEGCGVVVLKRLDDALADGDRVLAVIEGSAINQDGHSSGLTVPNGAAQQALIRQALANAGIEPGAIDYVEAHGTGTPIGDPIEVSALAAVFGPGRDARRKLRIGSVKTNLGHTESASGVAGLIKCVLALQHEEIPAQLHLKNPTAEIDWRATPIEIAARPVPWKSGAARRRAGVSSFGFSGANAHVIVAEAPIAGRPTAVMTRPRHILTFSAAEPQALADLAAAHAAALREIAAPLGDYCFTANTGRAQFRYRAAICAPDSEELAAALAQFAGGTKVSGEPVKVAFLFGGHGSRYAGMGLGLYETQPVFRAEMDRCAELAAAYLDRPLLDVLASAAEAKTREARIGLFAIEWSLAQLWRAWGIEPGAVLGEGVGGLVTRCQTGEMSLEQGLAGAAECAGGDVSIAERVGELTVKGCGIFIEIGCTLPAAVQTRGVDALFLPTLSHGRGEWEQILDSLAQMYLRGVPVDWAGFDRGYERRRIALPTYPFQRKRHWVDPVRPLLERQPGSPLIRESVFAGSLAVNLHPWLADHVVESQVIVPLTAYVEMAIEAGVELLKTNTLAIEDLLVQEPLIAGKEALVQLVASPLDGGEGWEFRIIGIDGAGGHVVHATCLCRRLAHGVSNVEIPKLAGISEINAEDHYRLFANHGIGFGAAFRGVHSVKRAGGVAIGEIRGAAAGQYRFPPALLDACLQPLIHTWGMEESAFVPFAVERIEIHGEPGTAMTSVCRSSTPLSGDVAVFDTLGQLIADVRGLSARRLEKENDSIYEIEWIPAASAEPGLPAASVAAAGALQNRAGYLPANEEYTKAMRLLEARSRAHIQAALQTPGLIVLPKYRQLLERLRGVPAAPMEANDSRDLPELKLLERCGSRLADILRGECDPLELLFDPALSGALEGIYSGSLTTSAVNRLAADVVAGIAAHTPTRKLRILEIGAGTGGTTRHVLPMLPADRVEYWFTDLSPALIGRARREFREHPFIRFEVVDIEQDIEALEDAEFDVILAANVVHATADLRDTLARMRRLLSPDGLLVLIEGTRPQTWIDLTFGLTDGWWRFSDRDLRPDYPLIDGAAWRALLEAEGFTSPIELAGPSADGDSSDFSVFVANKSAARIGDWLVLCDDSGTGGAIDEALESRGQRCVKVMPAAKFEQYGPREFGINHQARADFESILAGSADGFAGVINLWALNAAADEASSSHDVIKAQDWACRSLLYLSQALVATGRSLERGLWTITRGSQGVAGDVQRLSVAQSTAWGFAKTLALEHPELRAMRLDLDPGPDEDEAEHIAGMLLRTPAETQLAVRGGKVFTPRLVRQSPAPEPMELVVTEKGRLDSLEWKPARRGTPGPGEVEIRVEASALNFRDVLSALGLYPGDAGPLGGEVAGRVVGVGPGVTGLSVGDAVAALAFGGFNTHVVTAADLTIKKPEGRSYAEIATVPAAFSTAYYALVQLAAVRRGERVLIHTATGGVGLAAIQIARNAGCEIIATAGSPEKREYLRSLGIEHVFDSRSAAFGADIRDLFPAGVDVILNTLSGETIEASFAALSARGRFVELGKRGIWNAARVAGARPECAYFIVDLAAVTKKSPESFRAIFAAASAAIASGKFHPLPLRVYRREDAQEAFRQMAQARHIGKIVVACGGLEESPAREYRARPDGTYLITGGLSGLGLRTAEWLVKRGAKHLALMARGNPDSTATEALEAMRRDGAQVQVYRGDVAQAFDVSRVLGEISAALPVLRGVIHSAGVLDDGAVLQQEWPRFETVLLPKIAGAWNLHSATRGMPLDLFVCYSSASAILGSRGQSNHAAANAFLDALAHHRRGMGLPGLSINWGAWSGIGAAARAEVLNRVGDYGVKPITPEAGIAALESLVTGCATQAAVVPINWNRFLASIPETERSFFMETGGETAVQKSAPVDEPALRAVMPAAEAAPGDQRKSVQAAVRETILVVLGLEPDFQLDPLQGLTDLGMDSLTSIELRNRLQSVMGRRLPVTLAFDFPTLAALVNYFCPVLPEDSGAQPDMQELGDLSVEQTEQLLAEELAKTRALL